MVRLLLLCCSAADDLTATSQPRSPIPSSMCTTAKSQPTRDEHALDVQPDVAALAHLPVLVEGRHAGHKQHGGKLQQGASGEAHCSVEGLKRLWCCLKLHAGHKEHGGKLQQGASSEVHSSVDGLSVWGRCKRKRKRQAASGKRQRRHAQPGCSQPDSSRCAG